MRVTASGQVSLPAEVRRRWGAARVRIIDQGDRLIVEPASDNPIADLIGILAGPGPSYDAMESEEREVEAERDRRRYPWAQESDR